MTRPTLRAEDIIVDTREQKPMFATPPCQLIGIPTGDYSVVGYTSLIAVERKSLQDLLGSVGRGRDRFRDEFMRLAEIRYRAVVIEGTQTALYKLPKWGRVTAGHARGTMMSWGMEYNVQVHWAESRAMAKLYVHDFLRMAYEKASQPAPGKWTLIEATLDADIPERKV